MTQALRTIWVISKPGLAHFVFHFVSKTWLGLQISLRFIHRAERLCHFLIRSSRRNSKYEESQRFIASILSLPLGSAQRVSSQKEVLPKVWKELAASEVQTWEWRGRGSGLLHSQQNPMSLKSDQLISWTFQISKTLQEMRARCIFNSGVPWKTGRK